MPFDNAMKNAFRKAGIQTPEETVLEVAEHALKKHAQNFEAAVKFAVSAHPADPVTMFVLGLDESAYVKGWGRVIRELALQRRAEKAAKDGKVVSVEAHQRVAPNARSAAVNHGDESVKRYYANRKATAGTGRRTTEAIAGNAHIAKETLSKLDTFKLDGKPIGDWLPQDARAWARKYGYAVRFVDLLTQGMPDGGKEPIRYYYKGREAEKEVERFAAQADLDLAA